MCFLQRATQLNGIQANIVQIQLASLGNTREHVAEVSPDCEYSLEEELPRLDMSAGLFNRGSALTGPDGECMQVPRA